MANDRVYCGARATRSQGRIAAYARKCSTPHIDVTYFDALIELMHLYNAVCSNTLKANKYAKKIKAIAQKVLDEASDVLEDKAV